MLACDICRELYWPRQTDSLLVCEGCLPNLSATLEAKVRPDVLTVDEETVRRLLCEHQEESRHGAV